MSKIPLDRSFARQGRGLAEWLGDLVADHRPTRQAAGEALGAMWRGFPSYSTDIMQMDLDEPDCLERQAEAFQQAIRDAVAGLGFPTAEFVRRLCLLQIALQEDWEANVTRRSENDRVGELQERLIEKFIAADEDAERADLAKRFCRLFCASVHRDNREAAKAESLASSGIMAHVVFDALDTALLADRASLRAILHTERLRYQALQALARIGPEARAFAGELLEDLDGAGDSSYFEPAEALGSIARNDAFLVGDLIGRLRHGDEPLKVRTAAVFYHLGPDVAGQLDEVLGLLLAEVRRGGAVRIPLMAALGSVGRDRPEALEPILELARPRPPRWMPFPGSPEHRYDEVLHERGAAIDALGFFPRLARRVVPVLVDAFDTFEEPDPDYCYGGERVRVCHALKKFGPAALPIVPIVLKYLEAWPGRPEDDRTWPADVFSLLVTIGPAAAAALPALRWFRKEHQELADDEPLDLTESLDRAIAALQGGR